MPCSVPTPDILPAGLRAWVTYGLALAAGSVPASAVWHLSAMSPAGTTSSSLFAGVSGQQVGSAGSGTDHAGYWSDTAASFVDLDPAATLPSYALATNGTQQGGYYTVARVPGPGAYLHAALWSGTVASFVDLNPASGYTDSQVYALTATTQGGTAFTTGFATHAALWSGTAGSFVDLHVGGYLSTEIRAMSSSQQGGFGRITGNTRHAVLWSGAANNSVTLFPAPPTAVKETAIYAMTETQQGGISTTVTGTDRAAMWSGTLASQVNLHPSGATSSRVLAMTSAYQAGQVNDQAAVWQGTGASWFNLHPAIVTQFGSNFTRSAVTAAYTEGANTMLVGYAEDPVNHVMVAVKWSEALAPVIDTQPVSQTINVGDSATFSVTASGTDAPFTYQWRKGTVNIDGATGASYNINPVAVTDAGSYDVIVTNAAGSVTSNAATLTVNKLTQTITFNALADRAYTATPFTLSASASSSLAVSFSVQSGPASLSGSDLTITGVGTVTVRAAQAGNPTYAAATVIDRSFAVSKATATVTLGSLAPTYNGSARAATATTSPVGLTVNFTYDGSATAPTNAGSYAVVGTISDALYQGGATGTLVIAKADQAISFTGPANQPYSATPITLSATASSGLTVSFAVQSGPATITGSDLTLTGAGSVTVRASQSGDANRNAAPNVDQAFTVTPNFSSWAQSKFTAGELLDANISGPNAVYGHDGLSNLVKYALELEPKTDITAGLPAASTTATDWVYTYTRPDSITDVSYAVEVSTDLVNWTTAGVTHELVSSGGGTETWHGKYPLAGAPNCYFRLKVTR